MKAAALVLAMTVAAAAAAESSPFTKQSVAGKSHEDGEARWTDRLEREASTGCSQTPSNCVRNSVIVQNDSPRPIQCMYRLDYRGGDDTGRKRIEEQRVIFPGRHREAAVSRGPAAPAPGSFHTQCFILPAPPLAALDIPRECSGEILGPSPDKFYPPASQRQNEQGVVVLEFKVARFSAALGEVRVVGSSGFMELDNAALEFSKHLTQRKYCPGRTYRFAVRFVVPKSAPLKT